MADTYNLTCFDCRESISLGKIYCFDSEGKPLDDFTCDGVWDRRSSTWNRQNELFGRAIEKFLILHRNHELRFVPEGVDELFESTLGFINDVDADEVIARPVDPEPDAVMERESWKEKIDTAQPPHPDDKK